MRREAPRGTREAPRGTREAPRGTREATRRPPEGPRGPQRPEALQMRVSTRREAVEVWQQLSAQSPLRLVVMWSALGSLSQQWL